MTFPQTVLGRNRTCRAWARMVEPVPMAMSWPRGVAEAGGAAWPAFPKVAATTPPPKPLRPRRLVLQTAVTRGTALQDHALGFEEGEQPLAYAFTPDSGLLEPAERHAEVTAERVVANRP